MNKRLVRGLTGASVAAACCVGCGDRSAGWDTVPSVSAVVGLSQSVALLDQSVHSATFLSVGAGLDLRVDRELLGVAVSAAKASSSGRELYVLTAGVRPRQKPEDERPALWVYHVADASRGPDRYDLNEANNDLAVDPYGQFVVLRKTGQTHAMIENRNELVLVDVTKPASATNPSPKTITSRGGVPQRFTFTPTLNLPGGPRRLLVVETDREVSVLDLNHLERSEVRVDLNPPEVSSGVKPVAILVDDGAPDRNDDARIAVRTEAESSVYMLTLVRLPDDQVGKVDNDFTVQVNIVGLNSLPSDFAFVRTDAGRRLAVLEPTLKKATLVDPDTSVATSVDLPLAYGRMAVVTDQTATPGTQSNDVALLWAGEGSASAIGVAFWSLGKSVGQPYRSIELLNGVKSKVEKVIDVPQPNQALKILVPSMLSGGTGTGTAGQFYVLDLSVRTAAPLFTSATSLSMTVSDDGKRAWFYQANTTQLAKVDLQTLHPQNLVLPQAATQIFDIARTDGGRAVVALHPIGTFGVTVLDAIQSDEATARRYAGLLQGGF